MHFDLRGGANRDLSSTRVSIFDAYRDEATRPPVVIKTHEDPLNTSELNSMLNTLKRCQHRGKNTVVQRNGICLRSRLLLSKLTTCLTGDRT